MPPRHPLPGAQTNDAHRLARTMPHGRALMVRRIEEEGWTAAREAEAFGISERTVRKRLARSQLEGAAGLENRSSRPGTVANRLAEPWMEMAARLRRELRMTGDEIAGRLRLARSTVAGHLARLRIGQLSALEERPPVVRFERERPGELLHSTPSAWPASSGWAIASPVTAAAPRTAQIGMTCAPELDLSFRRELASWRRSGCLESA